MTDYSVTVSESIRSFGGGPTSKWSEHNWNAFKWGDGTLNVLHDVDKYVPESQASTDYRINTLDHYISEAQASSDGVIEALDIVIGTVSESISSGDGIGFVYRMDTAETYTYTRKPSADYTSAPLNSTSWTEFVPNSTTWTDA